MLYVRALCTQELEIFVHHNYIIHTRYDILETYHQFLTSVGFAQAHLNHSYMLTHVCTDIAAT